MDINNNCKFIDWSDPDPDMSDLHVDSVTKSFGIKQVLTDIFISCKKGEIIGLLGKNGTGKSTLLQIIFGSLQADTKFVKIGDKIINGLFDNRKLINYLPQNSFLPNHSKVSRIIALFCNKSNAELIITNELIRPLLDRRIRHLSGGERRLIEIILIIHSDAKYILIDEPYNGIAPIYKEDIKRMIKERSIDKGFIITDHNYRDILDVATRIILLRDGGTKAINRIEELEYWGYVPETHKY
jgi:ABC-type multidrug transport system ATPase subunit